MSDHPSVAMGPELLADIDKDRGNTNRSEWFREAARMRLEVERAAEATGVDTGELPDGWWRDFLYSATREHLQEQREREAAREEQDRELEADD